MWNSPCIHTAHTSPEAHSLITQNIYRSGFFVQCVLFVLCSFLVAMLLFFTCDLFYLPVCSGFCCLLDYYIYIYINKLLEPYLPASSPPCVPVLHLFFLQFTVTVTVRLRVIAAATDFPLAVELWKRRINWWSLQMGGHVKEVLSFTPQLVQENLEQTVCPPVTQKTRIPFPDNYQLLIIHQGSNTVS